MSIPNNIVIAWSGTINQIPDGWFLCNGENNTPNLLNRSIISSGTAFPFNSTGGSADPILTAHTHEQLTVNETGNHSHTVVTRYNVSPHASFSRFNRVSSPTFAWGNNAGSHSHTVTLANSGTTSIANTNMPPYYALAFIMKGGE